MADVQKTIEIIFGAIDNTANAFQSVGSGLKSFADGAKDAIAPLDAVADGIKTLDTAVVAAGLALGGFAIKAAGDFSTAVVEVGTLFGGTTTQVDKLSESIKSYAAGSVKSIEEINGAVYTAVSAGIDWEKSIAFVAEAEKLSVAGKADLQATTLALVGTMNAYGASSDEAARYSDVMFKTVQLGLTTLPELATGLAQVTGSAAAGKVPFEEVAAAIAALTASGVPTTQAVTNLNQAILGIINPTKEASDKAAELGIQFNAGALASKGLSGVLADVQEKTKGNVTDMTTLFSSVEAFKAVTVLASDASGTYAKALLATKDAAGVTQEAYDAMSASLGLTTQKLKNNAELLLIEVGGRLMGGFTDVIGAITDVFASLKIGVKEGAFDDVFNALNSVSADITAFLKGVAAALPDALAKVDFSKFADAIGTLADAFGGLFGDLDLTTVDGLARAIQTAVDVIGNLLNSGAGIVDVWGKAVQAAMPLIEAFGNLNAETAITGGQVLGVADVLTKLLPAVGSVGSAIEALGNGISLLGTVKLGQLAVNLAGSATAMGGLEAAAFKLGGVIGGVAKVGLVGAAGAAGFALGEQLAGGIDAVIQKLTGDPNQTLGGLIFDLVNGTDDLATSAPKAATAIEGVGAGAGTAAPNLAAAATSTEKLKTATENVIDPFAASNKAILDASIASEKLAKESDNVVNGVKNVRAIVDEATGKIIGYEQATGNVATKTKDATDANAALAEKLQTSAGIMEVLSGKTDITSKDLITLAKNTQEAEFKLEQLASNEKIKIIEATVKLNVAQLEANTKQVLASFDSINNTIDGSNELLGTLFGLFDKFDDLSWAAQDIIESQIETENAIKKEQLELQRRLTEATIENMRAQTDSLIKGDALIKVDGAGLQPHLEAFMWEILKSIQVRVNDQGLALLLGV